MENSDFTYSMSTQQAPEHVFQTILDVKKWWSGYHDEQFHGDADRINEEFSFSAAGGAHYSKQRLVKLIPNKKIVWLVTEADFSYIENRNEWNGTKLIFEISEEDAETKVTFTHQGLTPRSECYDYCAPSWTQYLQYKLYPLITSRQPFG